VGMPGMSGIKGLKEKNSPGVGSGTEGGQ